MIVNFFPLSLAHELAASATRHRHGLPAFLTRIA
jgi:hypothetical protein